LRAGALASAASAAGYTGAAANPSVAPALRGATGALARAAANPPVAPSGALTKTAAQLVLEDGVKRTKPNRSKNSQEAADAGIQLEGNQTKDLLDKIRTSLDELREIVNKKANSKDKEQLLDKLDAIINTVERISRRLKDEAADPEAAEAAEAADPAAAAAGQAPPPTTEETIAIIAGLVAVFCVIPGCCWVSCNGGFANAFAWCCCIEDYLKSLDKYVGYERTPNRSDLSTSTPGAPVDLSIVGGLGVVIGFP